MKEPFELEWFGGAAERHFRKLRPGVDELPWQSLQPDKYPPLLVDRARVSWTEAAYNEYCTAAAFADVLGALLAAKAPIDLIGMAGDFIADELFHVELTSRVAMQLGGGAPYQVDFSKLTAQPAAGLSPIQRASEMLVRLCCVGEAFSVPMLSGCMRSSTNPLTHAVLETIVRDEAPHGRLGWLYLEWIQEDLDDEERQRLAAIALDQLRLFEPYWRRLRSTVDDGVTSEGFKLADIQELGWMESQAYGAAAREAVRHGCVEPLRSFGIVITENDVATLLA